MGMGEELPRGDENGLPEEIIHTQVREEMELVTNRATAHLQEVALDRRLTARDIVNNKAIIPTADQLTTHLTDQTQQEIIGTAHLKDPRYTATIGGARHQGETIGSQGIEAVHAQTTALRHEHPP